MQQYSDEELVAMYKESRDHQYLTELFTRHSGLLYRSAFRTMKNPSDAEDILQTAYIKMISDLPNYKGTGSVIGWMLQVVIHTCYERFRSEKSRLIRERKVMSERNQTTKPNNYE
jgi:RNA polymerase sigma-70 factor (ECF subfamily)